MARTVLILGFEGVQALDMVGPFEVFAGAAAYATSHGLGAGYTVGIVSVAGIPVSTRTGITLVADPLPDPTEPVDTVVLPAGWVFASQMAADFPSVTIDPDPILFAARGK